MYIDFDKLEKKIHINYYLDEINLVIKIPIKKSNIKDTELKIEKFNIINYIYLTNFE